MAEVVTMKIKVDYDMQAIKDALRTERMWYLEAFEKMEYAFEDVIDYENPDQIGAMDACRDRILKLMEGLADD